MNIRQPTVPQDNGKRHYGAGLKGSLCGVETPGRLETSNIIMVTCLECARIKGRFMREKKQ